MSDALGRKLDTIEYEVGANWKIAVENTLESYHVNFVHTDSFARLDTSGCNFTFDGSHSSWTSDVSGDVRRNWNRVAKYYQGSRMEVDGYFHQLVFPNITIVSVFGSTFSIQQFLPIGPDRTRFISHVFEAALPDVDRNHPVVRNLSDSSVRFNREVFAEDSSVCEDVQRSVSESPSAEGVLGLEEERVERFQQCYLESMEAL